MEYYSTVKMNEIMPFSSWQMDLEIIILSQAEKDKHYIISLYMQPKTQNKTHRQLPERNGGKGLSNG